MGGGGVVEGEKDWVDTRGLATSQPAGPAGERKMLPIKNPGQIIASCKLGFANKHTHIHTHKNKHKLNTQNIG